MALQLGDTAPDFTVETTEGTISLHDYLGDSWGILFSHPADFTPVCTTELGAFAAAKESFDRRNTKLLGVSVDPVDSHRAWSADIAETQGSALNFPLIGDENRTVADLYGMIHPNATETLTVRTVFVIGPDKKIKLTLTYRLRSVATWTRSSACWTRCSSAPSTACPRRSTGRTATR